MDSSTAFGVAADIVLLLHVFVVLFVVVGLVLILVGKIASWAWVRNYWFRVSHLGAIGFVAIQSWFGAICPLTKLETALRLRAGSETYTGTFMSHWLESVLYYQAPTWAFAICYTIFGAAVIGTWYWVHPTAPSPMGHRRRC